MYHSDIIGEWKIIRYIEDKHNQKKFELLCFQKKTRKKLRDFNSYF